MAKPNPLPAARLSHTQHTIAIHHVVQIVQGVRLRGLNADPLLQRAGIAPALLESPLSRVTQAQFASLIFSLRRVTRDELWGLCIRPLRVGSFAQACRLLVHCETLGDALRAGCQFYHLMMRDFIPRLSVQNGLASYRLHRRVPRDASRSYLERLFLFFSYGLACWLVARRMPLHEVTYPASELGCGTDAGFLFQVPVRYAGDSVSFSFAARWLDLPVVQSRQSLAEFLKQAPASLLVRYRDHTTLAERIRRLLRKRIEGELPSLEAVSQSLAMTPQTLRRRLAEEGTGYQAIKDDLRRDAAIEYLSQPELTLIAIANRLGFSEASTFHRAFKGWTGLAPGVYRQTRLGGSALP